MLNNLKPLIKKTGSSLSPEQFHERVNIVFHDFESDHYDSIHSDMNESLQEQVDLLINDLINNKQIDLYNLNLLDIGCGTGLSTKLILDSKIEEKISSITLLDTSPNMLKQAEKKAKQWNKPYKIINDHLSNLNEKFDIIIVCSVLHHIPNLDSFLKEVNLKLNSNGVLIHLQDPNFDFLDESVYKSRKREYGTIINKNKVRGILSYVPKHIKRKIKIFFNKYDYIDKINNQLLSEKTIKKRMSSEEIWSVTDIHVETKEMVKGISLSYLKSQLTNFELINMRSYGFFGPLKSELINSYKEKENRFILTHDLNGRNMSCIWLKK